MPFRNTRNSNPPCFADRAGLSRLAVQSFKAQQEPIRLVKILHTCLSSFDEPSFPHPDFPRREMVVKAAVCPLVSHHHHHPTAAAGKTTPRITEIADHGLPLNRQAKSPASNHVRSSCHALTMISLPFAITSATCSSVPQPWARDPQTMR